MGFSTVLRNRTDPLWRKTLSHPFVVGIGRGTLPREKFRFYMEQDYAFLIEYSRVLALAVPKTTDLTVMGRFAALLHATLSVEMSLHRGYAARFGIRPRDLERVRPAPTTHAYTRHLLHVASFGTLADLAAALLPCQWGYWEIGRRLVRGKGATSRNPYIAWIQMYSSKEFRELAVWVRRLVDALARRVGPRDRARMADHFVTSSRYEYLFWEMSWRREEWPH